jgi:menaquinone-9 beta-reductase
MLASGRQRWDAVVVGAGPAGAVVARLLALAGATVLLVDRKALGRDKVCGCCWSASGLELLQAIGARQRVAAAGGVGLNEFALQTAAGNLRVPLPHGLAVSRAGSDAALVQLAVEAGVCFQPQVQAMVGPAADERRVVRLHASVLCRPVVSHVEAGFVIAADGLGHPSLGELAEFSPVAVRGSHLGAGCRVTEFPAAYHAGTIFMAVAKEGYVGLVVLADGSLNIAAALSPALVRREGTVARAATKVLGDAGCPAIPAVSEARWSGTPLLTRRPARVAGQRLLLVGDAAGYAEPFTGEGMTWAVLAACAVQPLAQRALRGWTAEMIGEWTATYQTLIGRRQQACRRIAGLLRSPLALAAVTQVLKLAPGLAPAVARLVSTTPAARTLGGKTWQRA